MIYIYIYIYMYIYIYYVLFNNNNKKDIVVNLIFSCVIHYKKNNAQNNR